MMLGIGTNVLIRLLLRDDDAQFQSALRLIGQEALAGQPVLISHLVLLETEWVLRSRYGLQKPQILGTISGLLDSGDVQFEDEPAIEEALFIWKDAGRMEKPALPIA